MTIRTTRLLTLVLLGLLAYATPALAIAPEAPEVLRQSTSAITPTTVTLEAVVNPENQTTTECKFEYGTTISYGSETACEQPPFEGSSEQFASAAVTGLKPGTTYHYRTVIANATGTTKSTDGEFTTVTLEKPLVSGENVSSLGSTEATLNAFVNPNYQETTFSFQYATNEALSGATTIPGASPLTAEFTEVPVSVQTGPLTPRTTYYYRALATNGTGTNETAPVEHFTTLATPAVTTGSATAITRTSAEVEGTVNPSGTATTYHFVYINQTGYEAALAQSAANPYQQGGATATLPAGSSYVVQQAGPAPLEELSPGTTYHYAVVATNFLGTVTGADHTFTTAPPTPPIATTGNATAVSTDSATLTATVDTRGLQTSAQFELATTPGGTGSLTTASIIPDSETGSTIAVALSYNGTLQPDTTYYYRAIATNPDGTSLGQERSFTTASVPGLPTLIAPAFPSLANVAPVPAPGDQGGSPTPVITKTLTRAQKLAKALKQCRAKHNKHKRTTCEKQARQQYAPSKNKGKK